MKRLKEVDLELSEMMKKQFKLPSKNEESEFINRMSFLKEEKQTLEKEIAKLSQELRYRFPERGMKSNSKPIEEIQVQKIKEKNQDHALSVSEDAVTQSMESLRRQFGSPLSPEEKRQLEQSINLNRSKKSGKNPIQDKIIISK